MRGNYNAVAAFYDRLARLVFGDALVRSQSFLLQAIPEGASVLLVGGGSGWILEEIAKLHKRGLLITYVEISGKMMARAKKRNAGKNKVEYIEKPVQEVRLQQGFDVIITPFLFDNFSENTSSAVFQNLDLVLKEKGLWLFADFRNPAKLSHRILLKSMYLFFGLLCRLETSALPNVAACFEEHRYKIIMKRLFYEGFIDSIIYQKQ